MKLRENLLAILSVLCVSALVCGCLGGDTSSEVTDEEVTDPDEIWVQEVETSMEDLDEEENAVCGAYLNYDLEQTRAAKKVLVTHVNSLMSWSQSSYVTPGLEDLKTEFEAYLENLKVVGQTSEFVVYHANREEWDQADNFAERFNGNLSSALEREKNIKIMLGEYRAGQN